MQQGLYGRCDSGPASLLERGKRRRDVPPEIANPAAGPIARDPVNWSAGRPLVEEIREVDAGSHRDLERSGEPRGDLHQVRHARGVPAKLDFREAFADDFAYDRVRPTPDVIGK